MIKITTKRNQKVIIPRKEEISTIYENELTNHEGATIHLKNGGVLIVNQEQLKKIIKWLQ